MIMRILDSHQSPLVTIAVSSLLVSLAPSLALASEYSFEYGAEAGYEYNDNIALRADAEEEIAVSGVVITIPATLASHSDRHEASLVGEAAFARYDEEAYDSDDQNLEGRAKYLFEYSELEGYAGYRRDSTRSSEFLDTGVVGRAATPRETLSFGGAGSHAFTETNGMIGGIDFADIDYDSEFYQDHKFFEGYFGWTNRWSEHLNLRLQGYGNRFDNEGDIQVKTDSLGAEFGFDYVLSDLMQAELLAGWVWVETEYTTSLEVDPEDSEANGLLLEGSLTYSAEYYQLEANIQSRPKGSGYGYMLYTQQLGLDYRLRLSEHTNFALGFTIGQSDAVDDRIKNNRDYVRARLGLDYHFSKSWTVSASYEYSEQDLELERETASSNAVHLSLIFKPDKSIWSR
jgi:hypothetical protein